MRVIVQDVFSIETIIKVHRGVRGGEWWGSDAGEKRGRAPAFRSRVAPDEERCFCFTDSIKTQRA